MGQYRSNNGNFKTPPAVTSRVRLVASIYASRAIKENNSPKDRHRPYFFFPPMGTVGSAKALAISTILDA